MVILPLKFKISLPNFKLLLLWKTLEFHLIFLDWNLPIPFKVFFYLKIITSSMFFKKLTWIRPNQFLHLWPMEPPSHLTQETFFVTLIYIAASLVVYNMPLSLSPKFILLSTVYVNSCINNCNHIGKLLNAFFVTFTTLVTMVFLSSFILHLI